MTQYRDDLLRTMFVSSMTIYQDHYPKSEESAVRIVIRVRVGNEDTVPFIVDTGAPWCVVSPYVAQPLIADGRAEPARDVTYIIRGHQYKGRLYRIPITLVDQDDEENDAEIEATVFVATMDSDEEWTHPNFLGLDGFLDRMRFAVDPEENAFYFGKI